MLAKAKRLNLKTDFKWVASGKKIDSQFAKIFIRLGENSSARVGIATSKNNFKNAVSRNKARRLISAAIEILYDKLPTNINIIVLPKAGILEVKSRDILLDLEVVFTDEKIIN